MKKLMLLKSMQRSLLLLSVLFSLIGLTNAQTGILVRPNGAPDASPTPLVKKTGETRERVYQPNSTTTTKPAPYNLPTSNNGVTPTVLTPDTAVPDIPNLTTTGMRGILVETEKGQMLQENASDVAFNPASNVKLITTLAALKQYGPNARLQTNCYSDGTLDTSTGTLYGNLYISGADYSFNYEHAVNLANELNKRGIRTVNGDVIVAPSFTINFNSSPVSSAKVLVSVLDSAKRPYTATSAWQKYLAASGKYNSVNITPSVTITGNTYIEGLPANSRLLFSQESAPMKDLLKAMLCFSNNFMAERLGNLVGGYEGVAAIARNEAGISFEELRLASSSGLGINRVTPRAMMKVLRALVKELDKYKMNLTDICPVAGIDVGTLEKRQTQYPFRGSVVGKTGTLPQTDSGVSTLVGQLSTNKGVLYFVIFNQRGNVNRFRAFQDDLIVQLALQNGGAKPFFYSSLPLSTRLANLNVREGQPPLTAVKLLN